MLTQLAWAANEVLQTTTTVGGSGEFTFSAELILPLGIVITATAAVTWMIARQ